MITIRLHYGRLLLRFSAAVIVCCTIPASAQVIEGGVYRETSAPEVYLIAQGKKVWVPTPDALFTMGFDWGQVTVVPDGTLNSYQRVNIPSSSATPGSLVFPPNHSSHFPLAVIPKALAVSSRGKAIQLVELYGWLRMVGAQCEGGDPDFHYALEVDTEWAAREGIDLNALFRAGTVARGGIQLTGFSPRRAVSLPVVSIELNAWQWRGETAGRTKPTDWTFEGRCDVTATWPFDPLAPAPGQQLGPMTADIGRRGPYVRVAGSLVTDSPHDVQHRPSVVLSRWLAITPNESAEWEGSVPDWHPGVSSTSGEHFARWTELHPLDFIEVQPWKAPEVTVRAVALAARVGALLFGLANSCEEAEFDIFPEAVRPPNGAIAFEELRGPETLFPWGENANNGSWATIFDDHIRVRARVCGGPLGGSPGRFKAIYRVWWKAAAPGSTPRTGSFVTPDRDEIRYYVEPGAVDPNVVEFRLCLGPGLTWEKRMKMPDGEGSAWDIVVKDNTRCDANSLWAQQVANGQSLSFSKAKEFGNVRVVHAIPIASFFPLSGGFRITFTWVSE